MTDAILQISDGTTTVNLINPSRGFHLLEWIPEITDYKNGGVFQNPPLADWRQLRSSKWATAQENMGLHVHGINPDATAKDLQTLRQLLEKANQYWTTDWQNNPVWLEAKAKCETNSRYAVIVKGRLANDSNYYAEPFTGETATGQNLPLQVERRSWLSNIPGSGVATNISAVQHYDSQWCLDFDGDNDEVNCGSDAGLDNLPTGANGFTAEAWIKPDSLGENDEGQILYKSNWNLRMHDDNGIRAIRAIVTTDDVAAISVYDFVNILDGNWHHVAMTYDDGAASRVIRLWIDGVEASPYSLQQAATGTYFGDAADDLLISRSASAFDGCIAWSRISDDIRYTVNFNAPELCEPPTIDGDTVAQWNMEEGTGTTIDNAEGTAARDGTISGASWNPAVNYQGCGRGYGNVDDSGDREVTTANDVYIANKHNLANITDIYNFDDSLTTFSSNLIDAALPTTLFPSPVGLDDIIYFGINTALPDSGPFASLVFDLTAAAFSGGTFVLTWEYWNGAWVTLDVQDNTDSFQNADVNSVHWEQPADWVTTTINGVTAYWVRVRMSTLPAGTFTNPTQQNRNIYSIVWPFIEIQKDDTGGDISSLMQIQATIVSDKDGPDGSGPNLYSNYMIAGLRSMSRGENFTAYLNCSDVQNNTDIDVTLGTNVTFSVGGSLSSTGRLVSWVTGGVADAMEDRVIFTISKPLAQEFFGKFRAYIYVVSSAVSVSDFQYRLRIKTGTVGASFSLSGTPSTAALGSDSIVDLGEVTIDQPIRQSGQEIDQLEIAIQGSCTADSAFTLFYELILIPTDESVFESIDSQDDADSSIENGRYLRVSSLVPKQRAISTVHQSADDDVLGKYRTASSSEPIIQNNTKQRIWFFSTQSDEILGEDVDRSLIAIAYKVQLKTNKRYLSLRGDQ